MCEDAKELKEWLAAWSLKVVEYEHQFKVIDEAQKTFSVREMMQKDIKRFLTGPRKLEHDTKMTQNDSDTSNDMSYEDVCAIAWKGYKAGKGSRQEGTERIGNMALWERS